jgi:calcium/calmodulin-dependent protein kinase I
MRRCRAEATLLSGHPCNPVLAAELCSGGSLVERLAGSATFCEREAAWILRQLLAAVAHLHDTAIAHLDIKPDNVVFAVR